MGFISANAMEPLGSIMVNLYSMKVYCTPRNHQGTIPAAKIRHNTKFVAFGGFFLTKIKVDPDSWCNYLFIKLLRIKKIPKDNFT